MDPLLVVSTVTLLWVPWHLRLTKTDFCDLQAWIGLLKPSNAADQGKDARAEEEMVKLRLRNYKLFSRFLSQVTPIVGLGLSFQALKNPGLHSISWASSFVLVYWVHLLVGKELVTLTERRLRLLTYMHHVLCLSLHIMAGIAHHCSTFNFTLVVGFNTTIRFLYVLTFMNPSVSIPFQLLHTTADIFDYLMIFDGSHVQLGALCFCEFFICIVSIAGSVILDLALRGRIDAKLDTADAESLVSSFRRVLRGVCDGEVLLDGEMNVAKESECLKNLILTDVSLVGRNFKGLLSADVNLFNEFIESSNEAFGDPKDSPPSCLRVSLRGAAGIRVAADVYHVPVPGLFGADAPYHLIAFKEDPRAYPRCGCFQEKRKGGPPGDLMGLMALGRLKEAFKNL